MKRFLVACTLLLLLISGVWVMQSRVSASANHLLSATHPLEEALLAEDAPRALRSIHDLQEEWESSNGWMYLLLSHEEMDDLAYAAQHLELCLRIEDFPGALASLSNIKQDLCTMANKDAFSWKNIL